MTQLTREVGLRDHIQGKPDADVALVEYGDYECPYCGMAYWVVKRLQSEFGDSVAFVYRHFPLSQIHPHALHAAFAAEAAALQGKFGQMHDTLFENQNALDDASLLRYALVLGLDRDRFIRDMRSDQTAQKVREDFMTGIRSGVNGTPTFFLNGQRHDQWYEYDALRSAIQSSRIARV